jgi:hypothetical protein
LQGFDALPPFVFQRQPIRLKFRPDPVEPGVLGFGKLPLALCRLRFQLLDALVVIILQCLQPGAMKPFFLRRDALQLVLQLPRPRFAGGGGSFLRQRPFVL